MKKNYFSIIFLLAFTTVTAQTTLTQTDIQPSPGDQVDVYYFKPTSNVVGPAGAGVTWDFNYLDMPGFQDWTFGGPPSGPVASGFPTTNLTMYFMVGAINTINMFRTDVTGQYYQGRYLIGAGDIHQDDKMVVPYPLSYGATTTDAFLSERIATGTRVQKYGDVQFEVDGMGSLILPNGVYDDVLRVKSVETRITVEDYVTSQGMEYDSLETVVTTYQWFKAGIHFPLLTISEQEEHSFITGYTYYDLDGSFIEEFILSDDELEPQQINASAFPNPVINELNVTTAMNDPEETAVTIFNLLGEEVQAQSLGMMGAAKQTAQIDVSNLDAGVYLARIETTSGASQAIKFIKQ